LARHPYCRRLARDLCSLPAVDVLVLRAAAFPSRPARAAGSYALSLHDALPIYDGRPDRTRSARPHQRQSGRKSGCTLLDELRCRSEEHTSELQSRFDLVCRLLLEKKKQAVGAYCVQDLDESATTANTVMSRMSR